MGRTVEWTQRDEGWEIPHHLNRAGGSRLDRFPPGRKVKNFQRQVADRLEVIHLGVDDGRNRGHVLLPGLSVSFVWYTTADKPIHKTVSQQEETTFFLHATNW
jgi:hypothetical protein